jgi:hypothetical protein
MWRNVPPARLHCVRHSRNERGCDAPKANAGNIRCRKNQLVEVRTKLPDPCIVPMAGKYQRDGLMTICERSVASMEKPGGGHVWT